MKGWIFLTTIFLVTVSGDEWGLLHFSKSIADFHQCVRNSSLWSFFNFEGNGRRERNYINRFTRYLLRRTLTTKDLKIILARSVEDLIANDPIPMENATVFRTRAKKTIEAIMLQCSDDQEGGNVINSGSNASPLYRLPYFTEDRVELRSLLNLILVNWPVIPKQMFSTQFRIVTLLRFFESAISLLDSVYSSLGEEYDLLIYMDIYWTRRAEFFFDGRDTVHPYVNHIYSTDYDFAYTSDNPNIFVNRRNEDFADRVTTASHSELDRLLRIYPVDPSRTGHREPFMNFLGPGTFSHRYYYISHLTVFWRLVLAILELLERGIVTYKSYAYRDSIVEEIPGDVVQMVSDDVFYRDYLLDKKRRELEMADGSDNFATGLKNHRRVSEPHLVMLIWRRIKGQLERDTVGTTTGTPVYESKKGKGQFTKGASGKNKRVKTRDPGPSTSLQRVADDNWYGYVTGGSSLREFLEHDGNLDALQERLLSELQSEIQNYESSRCRRE